MLESAHAAHLFIIPSHGQANWTLAKGTLFAYRAVYDAYSIRLPDAILVASAPLSLGWRAPCLLLTAPSHTSPQKRFSYPVLWAMVYSFGPYCHHCGIPSGLPGAPFFGIIIPPLRRSSRRRVDVLRMVWGAYIAAYLRISSCPITCPWFPLVALGSPCVMGSVPVRLSRFKRWASIQLPVVRPSRFHAVTRWRGRSCGFCGVVPLSLHRPSGNFGRGEGRTLPPFPGHRRVTLPTSGMIHPAG